VRLEDELTRRVEFARDEQILFAGLGGDNGFIF
jgi:hypothetical protein